MNITSQLSNPEILPYLKKYDKTYSISVLFIRLNKLGISDRLLPADHSHILDDERT